MPTDLNHIRRAARLLSESESETQQARAHGLRVAAELSDVLGGARVRDDIVRGLLLGAVREAAGDPHATLCIYPCTTPVGARGWTWRMMIHGAWSYAVAEDWTGTEIAALTAALVAAMEET